VEDQPAERLASAVLGPEGRTEVVHREAAMKHASAIAHGGRTPVLSLPGPEPEALAGLLETTARHAYRVTDEQVAALRSAGYAEGTLFELIVATAVGAGLGRRQIGLAAVAEWERAAAGDRRGEA
jgi:alkylhydroperoxidase family enzyme